MKNKKILLIIIIFLILILIAFAGVYAYISLDLFKSPKQLFAKYLDNQITQVKSINMGALGTVKDKLKNEVSETELEMKPESEYDESMPELKVGIKRDPINSYNSLTLKYSNSEAEDFINYELYADKEKLALKIPELNEKFFSIKINTVFEQLNKYINENELSDKEINLSVEKIEEYKNEFIALYNKYVEYVKTTYLTDDKFTAEKNVEIDVNGTAMKANAYIFALKATEARDMLNDIVTKILDENIIKELLPEENISMIKEQLETLDEFSGEDTLKICIYEKSGKTVKMEVKNNDELVGEFILTNSSNTESNILVTAIEKKTEAVEVGKTTKINYTVNVNGEDSTTVTTSTSISYNKDDIDDDEMYEDSTTTQKMTTTLNGETATCKILLDGEDKEEIKVNYKFGSKVKFPNVDDSIALEEYLDNTSKLTELMMECALNLQSHPNTFLGRFGTQLLTGSDNSSSTDIFGNNTLEDYNSSDNELPTIDATDKEEIENLITDALNDCLDSYKRDLEEDENTNIADYLTVNKMSEMILSSRVSNIELIDGLTIKCKYNDETYYLKLQLNADTLKVDEVKAYTEVEYAGL